MYMYMYILTYILYDMGKCDAGEICEPNFIYVFLFLCVGGSKASTSITNEL